MSGTGITPATTVAAGRARIFQLHLSDCVKQPPEQVRDN
jgi:hypothetical protein